MLVSTYNNDGLEDVLILMLKKSIDRHPIIEVKKTVTQIKDASTSEVTGYNIFGASSILGKLNNGPLILTKEQVEKLNDRLEEEGFYERLTADTAPKFVVGKVVTCEPLADSDHLNVTTVDIADEEKLQIVCGAANIAAGQKVVIAKEGAILPDGTVIWSGELRGVKSEGMVCSGKELGLDVTLEKKGILVLSEDKVIGSQFDLPTR